MAHHAPDRAAVMALAHQGRSSAEIAVELNVPRPLVDMMIDRSGVEIPRPRLPWSLPWQIAPEHEQDEDAQMLRLEQRRRGGEELSEQELDALSSWFLRLTDANGVVDYSTDSGFTWVPRLDTDRDYFRIPEGDRN